MNNPIFVTGSHRSGSTWVGKIISNANGVRYVHEPFNMRKIRNNSPFKYWFEYVSDNSDKSYQEKAIRYLESFYKPSFSAILSNAINSRSTKELYHFFKGFKGRVSDRTLIKDPIALFSSEWLYKNINCEVVMIIRHPAAFIASLKVKNWEFDFKNLLDQDDLMNDLLFEYKNDILDYSKNQPDMIEQGILLWNIIYATVYRFKQQHEKDWFFVKHEDLSMDPVKEFKKMFNFLNLEFDKNIEREIIASSSANESTDLKRDSKENIFSWKKRLSEEEINRIKRKTGPVWSKFYSESDWNQ